MIFPFILVPLLAFLNHLGGQDTLTPDPRIIFRAILIPLTISTVANMCGVEYDVCEKMLMGTMPGMALWAVFKWGPGFMALNTSITDNRDYTTPWYNPNTWITKLTDDFMNVGRLTKLTKDEINEWGEIYMIFRGGFMYPTFIFLAFLLNPWAMFIGLVCFFQGIVYRLSSQVLYAEPIFGSIFGGAYAAIIVFYLLHV